MNKVNEKYMSAPRVAKILGISHIAARNMLQSGVFGTPVEISTSSRRRHFRVAIQLWDRWYKRHKDSLVNFDELV